MIFPHQTIMDKNYVLNRFFLKLGRIIAMHVKKKKSFFPPIHKVVSFTFDDFPKSAKENGANILESYDVCGTFYVSLGFALTNQQSGELISQHDVLSLSKKRHEIGCHTFSHLDCSFKSPSIIREDCYRNQQIALEIANLNFTSFAYPYGNFDPLSKNVISKIYDTARSSESGINVNIFDLSLLKSVSLYEINGFERPLKWLSRLDKMGGWLIFYTHDVRKEPSEYGCSIDLFKKTLKTSINKGFKVLPISEALSLYAHNQI